jgi:hypothetical protein
MDILTKTKLVSAAIKHDNRLSANEARNPRARVNIYRLGHFLKAIDNIEEQVDSGKSLARALYDNANDRFLTNLEKAVGLPVTFGGGGQDKGRPD